MSIHGEYRVGVFRVEISVSSSLHMVSMLGQALVLVDKVPGAGHPHHTAGYTAKENWTAHATPCAR